MRSACKNTRLAGHEAWSCAQAPADGSESETSASAAREKRTAVSLGPPIGVSQSAGALAAADLLQDRPPQLSAAA